VAFFAGCGTSGATGEWGDVLELLWKEVSDGSGFSTVGAREVPAGGERGNEWRGDEVAGEAAETGVAGGGLWQPAPQAPPSKSGRRSRHLSRWPVIRVNMAKRCVTEHCTARGEKRWGEKPPETSVDTDWSVGAAPTDRRFVKGVPIGLLPMGRLKYAWGSEGACRNE
jgi:hypothetical protein